MASPLVIYMNSKPTHPKLDDKAYGEWYKNHHIPDIIKTGTCDRAALYFSPQEDNPKRWLALYEVPDFKVMDPAVSANIPLTHELIPDGKPFWEVGEFDGRQYELASVYDPSGNGKGMRFLDLWNSPLFVTEYTM
jgi:hypothetical protein